MNPLLTALSARTPSAAPPPRPSPYTPTWPPCGGDLELGICPDPLPSSTPPPAKCLSVGCEPPLVLGANEHGSNRLCLGGSSGRTGFLNVTSDCSSGGLLLLANEWLTCHGHLGTAMGTAGCMGAGGTSAPRGRVGGVLQKEQE